MKSFKLTCVVFCLSCVSLFAQEPAESAASPAAKEKPAAADPFGAPGKAAARPKAIGAKETASGDAWQATTERLRRELDRPTSMDFVEIPLKDAVLYLQENHQVPIVLRVKKLEEAGISPDQPITINLKGIRLSTALELMLSSLELTYITKDGILLITTPEEAQATLSVQVYNCRDLLSEESATWTQKGPTIVTTRPAGGEAAGGFGGGSGMGGMGMGTADATPAIQLEGRAAQFMNLLTTNVASQSWTSAGGPGSISAYHGLIVVTQTEEVHRQIERTLDMLREAAGLDPRKGTKVVR